MTQLMQLDGSTGEGGGALVRTALALSMITQKPFRIDNIRAGRQTPGLKPQHLRAIEALKELAPNTKTSHIQLGSTEFWFHPGQIKSGQYSFDIKTAGSISLFLQAILLPCLFAPSKVTLTIKGGTCGKWQASVDYMQAILLPNLQRFTSKLTMSITKRGYYPKGGGEIVLEITPIHKLKDHNNFESLINAISKSAAPYDFTQQGKCEYIKGFVNASKELSSLEVARRIETAATTSFRSFNIPVSIDKGYFPANSIGGEFLLWTVHSKQGDINPTNCTRLASSMLIEKGISSEEIGQETAKQLKKIINAPAGVDSHLADQLLVYMALLPNSSFRTNEITNHTKTNIYIIEQFVPIRFDVNESTNTITSKKLKHNRANTQLTLKQVPNTLATPNKKPDTIPSIKKIGNWTQLTHKKIHSGKVINVYLDEIINPNGQKGTYDYLKVMPGVRALPIDNNNNVYLIKEFRYPTKVFNVEAIGGGKEINETSIQAIKRELKEEAGLISGELIDIGALCIDPSTGEHYSQHFIAKDISFVEKNHDSTEEIELFCIPLDEAIEMCMNGKINNVETIAILFKAREWLRKNALKK